MKNMTHGNEARLILRFALPMLAANVLQQVYYLTDSIVVGRLLGKEALAAVGAGFPVMFLVVSMAVGISIGFMVTISRYYGARRTHRVKRAIDTAMVFAFAASSLMAAAGVWLTDSILHWLHIPADIMGPARQYMVTVFAGVIFLFGYNTLAALYRGLGDSRTPLYFLMIAVPLNGMLDLLFVLGLGWGVKGVALATILSQAAAFAIGLGVLQTGRYRRLGFHLGRMTFDSAILRQSLRIGIPAGAQRLMISLGLVALFRMVNGFGTNMVAAFAAVGRLDGFIFMPAVNLSEAISTFVGQNLGAGKLQRIQRGYRVTLGLAMGVILCLSAAVLVFRTSLVALFTTDPEVIRLGARYLLIAGGFYAAFAVMLVTGGLVRASGHSLVPMLLTLITLWVVRIPLSWFLSQSMGPDGIWLGSPAAWCVGMLLSFAYYKTGRWRVAPDPALPR